MKGFLLILTWIACTSGLIEGFRNGYHSRAGVDIVIDDERYSEVSLQSPQVLPGTIKDTQISNVLAQIIGTPQTEPGNLLTSVDLFARTTANMFFVIDGFTRDLLKDTSFQFFGSAPSVSVERTSRPYHPVALLATAVTGDQPSHHDQGHHTSNGDLSSVSVFDLAAKLNKDATVIGASMSRHHAKILSSHPGNTIFWNYQQSAWVGNNDDLLAPNPEILKQLGEVYEAFEVARGDIVDESIANFVQEVSFVMNAAQVLSQVDKDYFFSFYFRAPAQLAQKYGANSKLFEAAMKLIDRALLGTQKEGTTYQLLLVPSLGNSQVEILKQTILPFVTKDLKEFFFPYIHLTEAGKLRKTEICQNIRNALAESQQGNIKVFCAISTEEDNLIQSKRFIEEVVGNSSGDEETIAQFHLFFWFILMMVVVLFYAIYGIAAIEPDVGLYQSADYVKKTPHQKWQ